MLRQCELLSCTFEHCRFFASDLVDCKMLGSVFRDCTVTALHISGGNWAYTALRQMDLSHNDLSGVRLDGADLSGCDLQDCDFTGCSVREAVLAEAGSAGCRSPGSGSLGGGPALRTQSIKPGLISQKQCVWQNSPAIW